MLGIDNKYECIAICVLAISFVLLMSGMGYFTTQQRQIELEQARITMVKK